MKKATKKSSKSKASKKSKILIFGFVVFCALGLVLFYSLSERTQICVVEQGDIVCVDEKLTDTKRYEFPSVNEDAKAISAAPGNKFFIVHTGDNREEPLDVYDENYNYMGAINLPVTRYDMQKIQWKRDGSKAYILSDIGVLHELDVANIQLTNITDDRAQMADEEEFNDNKRGFIVDYYLLNDAELILTVQNNRQFDDENSEIQGQYNDTKLYTMSIAGTDIKQLSSNNRIVHLKLAGKNSVLFSVSPEEYCEWGYECRQLYSLDIDTGTEEIIAGKDLEFRDFTYSEESNTLYLVRGPGGSVMEVYYGPIKDFRERVSRVKFAQESGTTWGPLSLIPMSKDSLAIISSDGVKNGAIEKFNLKSSSREAVIDAPALRFDGVDQLVSSWQP